jgi:hypothetical protein
MLTKFAAALLAISLIAGSAIAAQPSGTSNAPAAQSQSSPAPATIKTGKPAKHVSRHRHHVRKHVARTTGQLVRHARNGKQAKTHQDGVSTKRS